MLKYEKKLFAYMDVLGFSSLVKRSVNDAAATKKINHFYDICAVNPDWYRKVPGMYNIEFMVMSDSIVAAQEIKGVLTHEAFKNFALAIGRFQNELAWFGIWLRGAIVVEPVDFQPERNFVVGPALVKAVEIEKCHAKYPRIVVDPDILKELNVDSFSDFRKHVNAYGTVAKILFDWEHPVNKEIDTKLPKDIPLFLDFFALNDISSPRAKGIVSNTASELKGDLSYYSKYRWLADYLLASLRLRYMIPHPEIELIEKMLS